MPLRRGPGESVRNPALASCLVGVALLLPLAARAADSALVPELPAIAQLTPGNGAPLLVQVLAAPHGDPPPAAITGGALDEHFGPFEARGSHLRTAPLWLRLPPLAGAGTAADAATPVLVARTGMDQTVTVVPQFGGAQDTVFMLPPGLPAMSLSTLLVRFVLTDRLYPLYGTLFSLQALYLAHFSGQGFHWPVLSWARPLSSYAWNVPVAISAAGAALFVRADDADGLLYYGLAPSMVAAAVFVALGTSDRLRAQSAALTAAEQRAQTDPLTGVLNRRSLIERLDAACMRARSRGLPVSVLFIEFIVILYGADAAAAHPIAERVCRRVSELRIEGCAAPVHLTCSIGVAASDTLGVWGQHLIAHADTAQYAAKRSGRNQVHLAVALAAV